MQATLLSIIAAGAFAAAPAAAQTIKPGLWQIDNKMSSANADTNQAMASALQQLGNLPPEQRQMLEQMAAKNGMAMPKIGADGGLATTTCVTPEMAAQQQIPTGQPGNCTSNNVAVAGGMKLSFTCSNPPSSGAGRLNFQGDKAFTMTMQVTANARGTPEQMRVDSSGKWLASACPAGTQ
ncbi:hypothetical protein AAKU55_001844 [Oxalobacteraceae bacterium GrIS 1.11]